MGLLCECNGIAATSATPISVTINGENRTGTLTANVNICQSCRSTNSFINFSYTDDVDPRFNFTYSSQSVDLPRCEFFGEGNFGTLDTTSEGTAVGAIINGTTMITAFTLLFEPHDPGPNLQFIRNIELTDEDGDTFNQNLQIQSDSGEIIFCTPI
ncbi:hypothetical protein ACFFF5_09880 [Lederbergia wuyishanensis]|uniref:Cohesin domain-containing protein n=1 Tax=Lederbergia wuyishanensis TaxID=1347903 RepID=A0ABU0D7J6_9BACI|nr:hypothetical protein [Lederbergia wuyishanensis]MCJ8009006.1 hypothetical protein [Lederbergia wuyishanensis]MDQ0344338.1 hypothetical protein [Lederbergia wuyishanensis]